MHFKTSAMPGNVLVMFPVNTKINLWVPQKTGNFLTGRANVSFARRALFCGVYKTFEYFFYFGFHAYFFTESTATLKETYAFKNWFSIFVL
jgi:hypothetical protein